MSTHARIAQVLGPWFLASCTVEAPPPERAPDFEIHTQRVTIRGYGRSEQELCAGTLRWIDDYVDALAPVYDLEPGPIGAYQWYSDELWAAVAPCGDVGGCVWSPGNQPTAYSPVIPLEHEIVHMVNLHRSDGCIGVLEEGLAEHLRGALPIISGSLDEADIEHTLAASFLEVEWGSSDYHRARNFVSFLAFEYGLDAVVALCAAAPKGITRAQLDTAIQDVLGAGLEPLLLDYASYPQCPEEHDRAKLLECGRAPVIEVGPGGEEVLTLTASCAHPDAVGPKHEMFQISSTIRLLEDGDYSFSMSASGPPFALPGGILRFEQCSSCGEGSAGFVQAWDPNYVSFPQWYEAGDYALELQLPLDFSGIVSVRING